MLLSLVVLLALIVGDALSAVYSQTESHEGWDFLRAFSYEPIHDPSGGRVNYVNAATAARENLTFASDQHFVLRADFKKTLSSNGPGRDSVRLRSNNRYTTSVMAFNIRHMPEGCGTWPAVWTVGPDWPNQGEIDIIEGTNNQAPNAASLHTSAGCKMPSSRSHTGTNLGTNCDVWATNNAGCGVKFSDSRSFGPGFNRNGGGWYVVERTESFIKVWFWSRAASNVPYDVKKGAHVVNTGNWGTPAAYFPSNSCPIRNKFGAHNIVINLTFCGDWAGNSYEDSGCPSTCDNFVNKNPSAFTNAYFDFQWLKIYH